MDSAFAPATPGGSNRLSLPQTPATASSLKGAHEALSLATEDGILDAEAAAASAAQLLGEKDSLPCTPLGSTHHIRVKVRPQYKEEGVLLDGDWDGDGGPQTPYGA